MYQGLFLITLQADACNFIKEETLAQVFSCEFCEISKNIFFYGTPLVASFECRNNVQNRKQTSCIAIDVIPVLVRVYLLSTNVFNGAAENIFDS